MDIKGVSHPDEVLYGRAGYLYSLLFVDKYCGPVIPTEQYHKVCIVYSTRILDCIMYAHIKICFIIMRVILIK